MKKIFINKCSDSMMWYKKLVGQQVEYLSEDEDYYWSRDNGGYKNIILKQDADIVEEDSRQIDEFKFQVLQQQVNALAARVAELESRQLYRTPMWNVTFPNDPPWKVTSQSGN